MTEETRYDLVRDDDRQRLDQLIRSCQAMGAVGDLFLSPLSLHPTMSRHDGSAAAAAIGSGALLQAYEQLRRRAAEPDSMPSTSELREHSTLPPESSDVVVSVVDLGFDRVAAGAVDRALKHVVEGRSILDGVDVREDVVRRRFVAAAPLAGPKARRGGALVFHPETFVTDREPPRHLEVRFGDGAAQRVPVGGRVRLPSGELGPLDVQVALLYEDDPVHSRFTLQVQDAPPTPDLEFSVRVWIGAFPYGAAVVAWYADGQSSLTQPLVVAAPLGPEGTLSWTDVYDQLGESNVSLLRAAGFDVVIVGFADGSLDMVINARVLGEVLTQLDALKAEATRNDVVLGVSFGGVVARLALLELEATGGHQCSTFVSLDAPHGGCNVPLPAQWFAWYFQNRVEQAGDLFDLLESTALKQSLVYWAPDALAGSVNTTITPSCDDAFTTLQDVLESLGSWPSQTDNNYAIANGSTDGTAQGGGLYTPGTRYFTWTYDKAGSTRVNVWMESAPDFSDCESAQLAHFYASTVGGVNNGTVDGPVMPLDTAPGGYVALPKIIADAINGLSSYGTASAAFQNVCLVPTASALGLAVTPDTVDAPIDPEAVPFDDFYERSGDNTESGSLDAGAVGWLAGKLGIGL